MVHPPRRRRPRSLQLAAAGSRQVPPASDACSRRGTAVRLGRPTLGDDATLNDLDAVTAEVFRGS
jgi:hypothetical protein